MFESVESMQLADPATLAGALFALTDEQIADMSFEEAEAVVLASQRVMNAVASAPAFGDPGFKHHAGWQVTMDPVGTCTWTAPDGRTHTTRPLDRHGRQAA